MTLNLTGKLLLASPSIGDPRFERAVIALCAHDDDGALGVGIAMPTAMTVAQLFSAIDLEAPHHCADDAVLLGGPVEPQRGFVLHSPDWMGPGSVAVCESFAMSGSTDVLHAVAAGNGPAHFRVALGYAGWAAGQLEQELGQDGGWHVAELSNDVLRELIFDAVAYDGGDADDGIADLWARAYALAGIDLRWLAGTAGRA